MRFGGLKQRALQVLSRLAATFAEACADHDRAFRASRAQLRDQARHRLRGRAEDCQIGSQRQGGDIRIGQRAGDSLVPGIYRQDGAIEAGRAQVAGNYRTHGVETRTGADERNGFRAEDRVEVSDAHFTLATSFCVAKCFSKVFATFAMSAWTESARMPGTTPPKWMWSTTSSPHTAAK